MEDERNSNENKEKWVKGSEKKRKKSINTKRGREKVRGEAVKKGEK